MELWLSALVTFFAAYGLLVFAAGLLQYLKGWPARKGQAPFVSLLLIVKNQETVIEGIIQDIIALGYLGRRGGPDFEVVAVDDRSTDHTSEILERLAGRYPSLKVVRMAEVVRPGESPVDVGLFLCRSRAVLLFQVKGQVRPKLLLSSIYYLLGDKNLPAGYQVT